MNKAKAKREKIILLSTTPVPIVLTVVLVILYIIDKSGLLWLTAATAASWFALAGLFLYAEKKKWGCINSKGAVTEDNFSIVTKYNIVLLFALGAVFTGLFFMNLCL